MKKLKHKTIIENFSFLSILQLYNILFNLLTYPYLIRVVGSDIYGKVIFARAFCMYFVVLINFGFDIYAVKEISIFRNDKNKLQEIFSSSMIIRFLLLLLSFIILFAISFLWNKVENNKALFFCSFLYCVGEFLFPVWFFQGMEKMKYITYLNVFIRTLFAAGMFIFIKDSSNYLWIPILFGVGKIIAGFVSLFIIKFKYKVSFIFVEIKKIYIVFKDSFSFFLSRASSVFKNETNTLLIGVLVGYSNVAYYDLAKRVVELLKMPYNVLNQTVYPRIAKTKNMNMVKKIIKFNLVFGLFVYLMLIVFSKYIILILGGEAMMPAQPFLWALGITVPMAGVSFFLGNTSLVVCGHSKEFNKSVIYGTVFYFVLVGIFMLFNFVGVYQLITIIVLTWIFEIAYRMYYVKKYSLFEITGGNNA